MRKLLCKLGLHSWGRPTEPVYRSPMEERLAMPAVESERKCACCGNMQRRDEHCLGFNPPEYVYRWYTVK